MLLCRVSYTLHTLGPYACMALRLCVSLGAEGIPKHGSGPAWPCMALHGSGPAGLAHRMNMDTISMSSSCNGSRRYVSMARRRPACKQCTAGGHICEPRSCLRAVQNPGPSGCASHSWKCNLTPAVLLT